MKRITFAIIGALVGFLFVFAFWAPFMGLEDSFDLLNLPGALVGAILGYVIGKEKDEKQRKSINHHNKKWMRPQNC